MGINAQSTFGSQFGNMVGDAAFGRNNNVRRFGTVPGGKEDREPAKYWINVGYQSVVTNEAGEEETIFVALPFGIPLDTMTRADLKGSANMVKLRAAQNGLLDQLIAEAKTLEPGQERILACDDHTGLMIQLRMVKPEAVAPTENELVRTLNFGPRVAD